jgi:hypothetical protein
MREIIDGDIVPSHVNGASGHPLAEQESKRRDQEQA